MNIMEKVSGEDLQYFFDQWIFKPGYPIIEFKQNWIPKNNGKGINNLFFSIIFNNL